MLVGRGYFELRGRLSPGFSQFWTFVPTARGSEVWRETARRERSMRLSEEARSEAAQRNPRQTAASTSLEEAAENVRAGETGGGRGTEIQHSSLIGLFGAISSKRCPLAADERQAGFILRSAVGAGPPQGGARRRLDASISESSRDRRIWREQQNVGRCRRALRPAGRTAEADSAISFLPVAPFCLR